jgi:periplasmic copper chaperone A
MKRFALRAACMAVSALVTIAVLAAAPSSADQITVNGAYSRPANDMGAVFLTIVNAGPSNDALDAARSDVADATEVHETYQVAGGDAMRHIPSLAIPAGQSVVLKSGGYHIMLIGLKRDLRVGDTFTIGLHFAHAGWVDVPVLVKPF